MSNEQDKDRKADDEWTQQCAAYFAICLTREHPGVFCDIEKITLPPYYALRLELPVQSKYTTGDVDDTAQELQALLFLAQGVLVRYSIEREDQE